MVFRHRGYGFFFCVGLAFSEVLGEDFLLFLMGSFWKITSSRMKCCVVLCNLLIRLINCSPPEVTMSRLLVQFNVILCMYSMYMNDLLFMIIITRAYCKLQKLHAHADQADIKVRKLTSYT